MIQRMAVTQVGVLLGMADSCKRLLLGTVGELLCFKFLKLFARAVAVRVPSSSSLLSTTSMRWAAVRLLLPEVMQLSLQYLHEIRL